MIGHLQGQVIFSDGHEMILLTASGVGHQVYFSSVLPEGSMASIFVTHVQRESSQELYGFKNLRAKKMFELLTSVKGVGPKGAFALVATIGVNQIIEAIQFENKNILTKAPGIGPKAASQMILDLSGKVAKIKMYSDRVLGQIVQPKHVDKVPSLFSEDDINIENDSRPNLLQDTLLACKELGFSEEKIIPLAQKILGQKSVSGPEQLIHLVLKEI